MLRRVALVRIDVSEEPGSSFIRVTRIGELGTTQPATSNRHTLRRNKEAAVKTSNLTKYMLVSRDQNAGQNQDKSIKQIISKCVTVQIFGNDSKESKFDSGEN
jgi:NMD protein affecting ribosome stability and mRNA decay